MTKHLWDKLDTFVPSPILLAAWRKITAITHLKKTNLIPTKPFIKMSKYQTVTEDESLVQAACTTYNTWQWCGYQHDSIMRCSTHGIEITKSPLYALQTDGTSPSEKVGEIHFNLTREHITLRVEALVFKVLDVDFLAGFPFLPVVISVSVQHVMKKWLSFPCNLV